MSDVHLSEDEYDSLSNQKADDWRQISEVNPSLFAVAGALFAAGVAQKQAWVVATSPLPLFLAVWHMVRHAQLQIKMTTYLDVFAPPGRASWEKDLASVQPEWWEDHDRKKLLGCSIPKFLQEVFRPSAWNTWLVIATAVACMANLVPVAGHYADNCWAPIVGIVAALVGDLLIMRQATRIQPEREEWQKLWKERKEQKEGEGS